MFYKSETVEGWMDILELDWLRNKGSQSKVMIEMGSWKGRSSTALIENSSGILFCIDTFKGSTGEEDLFYEVQTKEGVEAVKNEFLSNMKEFMDNGKVFLINEESHIGIIYISVILAGYVDLIFIDADHSEEYCSRDIIHAMTLLKEGGILSGHNTNYPGVVKALNKHCPGWKKGPGYIWYWKDKE